MWNDEALPRLQAIGLGADVAARTYRLAGRRRIAGGGAPGRGHPALDEPGRRDVRPRRGRRRPDLGRRRRPPVGRLARRVRSGDGSRHARRATSGRPARRRGATPSVRDSAISDGRSPPSRSRRAAAWRRCSATLPWVRFDEVIAGDAPVRPRPRNDRTRTPRTSCGRRPRAPRSTRTEPSAGRDGLVAVRASGARTSAAPRSGSPFGCATGRPTSPSRSRSRRRPASVTSHGRSSGPGPATGTARPSQPRRSS